MGYPLSGPVWRSLFKQKVIRDWSDFHLQIFGNIDVCPWSLQIECDLLVVVAVVVVVVVVVEVLFFTGPKEPVWALTGPKFAVVIKKVLGPGHGWKQNFFIACPVTLLRDFRSNTLCSIGSSGEFFYCDTLYNCHVNIICLYIYIFMYNQLNTPVGCNGTHVVLGVFSSSSSIKKMP